MILVDMDFNGMFSDPHCRNTVPQIRQNIVSVCLFVVIFWCVFWCGFTSIQVFSLR